MLLEGIARRRLLPSEVRGLEARTADKHPTWSKHRSDPLLSVALLAVTTAPEDRWPTAREFSEAVSSASCGREADRTVIGELVEQSLARQAEHVTPVAPAPLAPPSLEELGALTLQRADDARLVEDLTDALLESESSEPLAPNARAVVKPSDKFEPSLDVPAHVETDLAVWEGSASAVSGEHAGPTLVSLPRLSPSRRRWPRLLLAALVIGVGLTLWLLPWSDDPIATSVPAVGQDRLPKTPERPSESSEPNVPTPHPRDPSEAVKSAPAGSVEIAEHSEPPTETAHDVAKREHSQATKAQRTPKQPRTTRKKTNGTKPKRVDRAKQSNSHYDPEGI
jgi:hypothetical protein